MQVGRTNRRAFIAALGGAVAWPVVARAQTQKSIPRVGVLSVSGADSPANAAFRQGLREYGYVVGQNILLEQRYAAGKEDHINQLASELVAAKVDVINAAGSQATSALHQLTTNIPIVTVSTNPVGLGFVASLARPNGNITGVSLLGPEIAGKRFELLKELVPAVSKVGIFWNPDDPGAQFSLAETQTASKMLMVYLQILETRDVPDFERAFHAAAKESVGAIILLPAPLLSRNASRIAELGLQSRLPTLGFSAYEARAGELMSYGSDVVTASYRAAYFVDRILKGARPADLPVEQVTKFDLVINLKTAKALGLTVPPTLVARADEVIE